MNDLSAGDESACRAALQEAARDVVDYRGRHGLSSAPELRSMLADVLGADSMRCRADIDVLVAVATAAGGIGGVVRPGMTETIYDEHLRAAIVETGLPEPEVRWASEVWRVALGVELGPSRPGTTAATVPRRTDPTVLPDHGYVADGDSAPGRSGATLAATSASGAEPTTTASRSDGRATRQLAIVASALAAILLLTVLGAFLWLQRDGSGGTTTSSTGSTAVTATTGSTTPEVSTVWAAETSPDRQERELLDQQSRLFTDAESCRPILDGDPDPLGTHPNDEDEASIECSYAGGRTIVYSLFSDDDAMESFFAGRLQFRKLAHGQGEIGPNPPWELDYSDDPERGSGSIFGFQRVGDGARSEVGFIRSGASIYVYSYQLGTDYAGYYEWWADIFGGPANGT